MAEDGEIGIKSDTVKYRGPKTNSQGNDNKFGKTQLIQLVGILENEIQTRDLIIHQFKVERQKLLRSKAVQKKLIFNNPYAALIRDRPDGEPGEEEANHPLQHLQTLIAHHKKAEQNMIAELKALTESHAKTVSQLEDERHKHAQDAAQGDDVTYMLEKERERLIQQVEFEKAQQKKLEKENKRAQNLIVQERKKIKQVAKFMLEERTVLLEQLKEEQQKSDMLAHSLLSLQQKVENTESFLSAESKDAAKREAEMEKQLSEVDIEREQLKAKYNREEKRNKEFKEEIQGLRKKVSDLEQALASTEQQLKSEIAKKNSKISPSNSAVSIVGISGKDTKQKTPPVARATAKVIRDRKLDRSDGSNSSSSEDLHNPRSGKNLGGVPRASSGGVKPGSKSKPKVGNSSPTTQVRGSNNGRASPVNRSKQATVAGSKRGAAVATSTANPPTAKVLPLTQQQGKPGSPGRGTGSLINTGEERSRDAKATNNSKQTPSSNQPLLIQASSPSGTLTTKKVVSPRGNPPPIPPNKPTLIPQKFGPSSTQLNSGVGRTASVVAKKPDSLVEARKQFYASKLGGISGHKPVNTGSVLNANSNNSNAEGMARDLQLITPSLHQRVPGQVGRIQDKSVAGASPLHLVAERGEVGAINRLVVEQHLDPNLTADDGSTPVHIAALYGQYDCLKSLLQHGGSAAAVRVDGFTPLHAAAKFGHARCMQILLDAGSPASQPDTIGWQPLHQAASSGSGACVQVLLSQGISSLCRSQTGCTPLHIAAERGHVECLQVLLQHFTAKGLQSELNAASQEGWTAAHLAASLGHVEALELLCRHGLDLEALDMWQRTPHDVATPTCKRVIAFSSPDSIKVIVAVVVDGEQGQSCQRCSIGCILVSKRTNWTSFHSSVANALMQHTKELNGADGIGKTDGSPTEDTPDGEMELSLNAAAIASYTLGGVTWTSHKYPSTAPFVLTKSGSDIEVRLKSVAKGSLDQLAYTSHVSAKTLQTFLRLVEQYRNVVFYGPPGCCKSHVAVKLAQCLKTRQDKEGLRCTVILLPLQHHVTRESLRKVLIEKGFLRAIEHVGDWPMSAPILVLDGLDQINVSVILSDLMPALEHLRASSPTSPPAYQLHPRNCIIATMNRNRMTGLDLSVQQLFRWVHFKWDNQPVRCMLTRHIRLRLISANGGQPFPPTDGQNLLGAWVYSAWWRLNEYLQKLSLVETIQGPRLFYDFPLDVHNPEVVFRWLAKTWNVQIAPAVEEAIVQGSAVGGPTPTTQVVNTALCVLLRKAILPNCPFQPSEYQAYLSNFRGLKDGPVLSQTSTIIRAERRSRSLDRSRVTISNHLSLPRDQMVLDLGDERLSSMKRSSKTDIAKRVIEMYDGPDVSDCQIRGATSHPQPHHMTRMTSSSQSPLLSEITNILDQGQEEIAEIEKQMKRASWEEGKQQANIGRQKTSWDAGMWEETV
ncbi:cortactin-binding protein 2-like isoform X2 [Anneissia japonica]|uniref:cortactin-binding protein 2-like isoform X2 n=1 Tax=Anneissia japonica TaxID=1529436 RepID=UPI0014254DD8|nr:cortactin-binding protein 2-like isoform X2 [Anneissia japonica]